MSYLIIQTADQRYTSYGAKPPYIIGPFETEEDAEAFASDRGMFEHEHNDYGGCLATYIVWNDLAVTSPDEAAAELSECDE